MNNALFNAHICFGDSEHSVDVFLSKLRKLDAPYWADWFEELFKNSFSISEKRIEELNSLSDAQYELTISQTSKLLQEIRKGSKSFKETRLILLGDKAAGKTTFARRFQKLDAEPPDVKESTPGVDFHAVEASEVDSQYTDENNHTINIWDFAGHTVTHAAHKFFLSECAVYVIVLRGRTENGTSLNEWFESIKYYTGRSNEKIKVYILVNKSDNHIPQTDYDSQYDRQFDIEKAIHIDLLNQNKEGGPLDEFRKKIVRHIVNSPYYKTISSSILDIKREINKDFEGNFLASKTNIVRIVKKHMPDSNVDDILHILHSYGICFYYDKLIGDDGGDLKPEDIVLNPRWVTYVIYRLINFINNDQLKNPARKDGHILESEYKTAFSEQTVQKDNEADYTEVHPKFSVSDAKYPFISALARTFRLAYKRNDLLIFPYCLSDNYPNNKKGLETDLEKDFYVEITTSTHVGTTSPVTFPKDIIPAFIVERYKDLVMLNDKKTAHCSKIGALLSVKDGKKKAIAEVKKTEPTKIVVLVKNNDVFSYEFGAELVADLYRVIQGYNTFKEDKPKIKVFFKDQNGRNKESSVEEILENDSLVKKIVAKRTWKKIEIIALKIASVLHIEIEFGPAGFKFKLGK